MANKLNAFIKIPGGKRKSIPYLVSSLPKDFFDDKNISEYNYIEPFLGGGSLGLYLFSKKLDQAMLDIAGIDSSNISLLQDIGYRFWFNEKNPNIHNLWENVLENAPEIIELFNQYSSEHAEDEYYHKRGLFNSISFEKKQIGDLEFLESPIEKSALFLYLNKFCFNGLIRFNKSGDFNSPCGKFKSTPSIDTESMLNLRELRKKGSFNTISNQDFESYVRNTLDEDITNFEKTLVYFDPPYVPLSITSSFTEYNPHGFCEYDQLRLKELIDTLTKENIKVMLSNSSADWVYKHYKNYNIKEVKVGRAINSVANKRGKIKELLITNY
jgi:DNA adenine methylase